MDILGINVPPLAVAIGSIIVAFITGLGFGMGSETGKYLVNKYLKPKYVAIHTTVNTLHRKLIKKSKPKSRILTKAFGHKRNEKNQKQ